MNYYSEIKKELINNEITKKAKDYSKNRSDLNAYYNVGKILSEAGKHYGESIIKNYSLKLVNEVDKKYNTTNLKRMRQFYLMIEKGARMGHQLTWSHYKELIPLKDIKIINYYVMLCENNSITRDELKAKIKSKEYERLPNEAKEKLISDEACELTELIKNPVVIKTNKNYENISEKLLQKIILEDIESFMNELGNSFSFIGSEYKIKLGDRYNYIDLLLFNYEYNCFVVVELKVTELKKEHIGQIRIYMNYIDMNLRKFNQDKTIGIILCKKENEYIIEYCSDSRIIERKYAVVGGTKWTIIVK
mgnify:CR=1 FL=1